MGASGKRYGTGNNLNVRLHAKNSLFVLGNNKYIDYPTTIKVATFYRVRLFHCQKWKKLSIGGIITAFLRLGSGLDARVSLCLRRLTCKASYAGGQNRQQIKIQNLLEAWQSGRLHRS